MKELKNRKEKISFLRDVIAGKRKSSELLPEDNFIIVSMPDEQGRMKHSCSGKVLTEEEYKRLSKRNTETIVVEYDYATNSVKSHRTKLNY
jgi:hypothetical protein